MESFLGIPTAALAAVLAGLAACAAVFIGLLALRRPVLLRLGVRQVPRRGGRSVLIVIGLALSTTIVAASFGTGDAMGYSVRSLVVGSLGAVDEIVVSYPEGPRRFGLADLRGVAEGRIPVLAGADFPESRAGRVSDILRGEPGVAGVVGSIVRQYQVSDRTQQTTSGALNVLALPPDTPPAFGTLTTTGTDGAGAAVRPVSLGDLREGEVYLNQAAATLLAAAAGDELVVYRAAATRVTRPPAAATPTVEPGAAQTEITVRLRAIVANGDLGGTQPTLFADLGWWQQVDGADGRINQVLIRNQGGDDSLRWSEPVTRRLRSALIDDGVAADLHRLLGSAASREALRGSMDDQPVILRPRFERLLAELERPAPTDEFELLIADPQLLNRLRPSLFSFTPEMASEFAAALRRLPTLNVIGLKQLSVDVANQFAAAFTSTFLVLGLFSIATGVMLVFLIFALLAADRRPELGMARALGTQRSQLVQLLVYEGAVYDLAASILGVLVGLGVALYTLDQIRSYLATYSIPLASRIEPRSLVIAFCLGLLLTFATVAVAAWRIARLNVVDALRNLPTDASSSPPVRDAARSRARLRLLRAVAARGPLPVGIGLLLIWATDGVRPLVVLTALGWSLLLVGLALTLRWALGPLGVSRSARDRIGYTAAGAGLVLYWAQPVSAAPGSGVARFAAGLEYLALGGLLTVLGATWIVTYNLELLPRAVAGVARLVRGAAGIALLRLAAAYPARHRWRTGLAVLMFALVIFTVTTASVLLAGTRHTYTDLAAQTAGFDLRADVDPGRLPDLPARLADASAVSADAFAAVGGQADLEAEAVQLGVPAGRWQPMALQVVDVGWLRGVRAALTHRAPGYESDAEVWQALRERPGLAVLHGSAVPAREGRAVVGDAAGASPFRLQGVTRQDAALPATVVWLRQPESPEPHAGASPDAGASPNPELSARPLRLTVIGVMDARAALGEGIYTTRETVGTAGWTTPPIGTYYFSLAPGESPRSTALGLARSFAAEGLTATVLEEQRRAAQGVRLLLNEILTGFMALGLVSGVVGLGIIATRAVVERRQQIGVLRAIGFRRGLVHGVFLLESTLVAALGIAIGIGAGIVLAHNVVAFIALENPEFEFAVPWAQVALIGLIAYGATLLTTFIPAWRAGHVYPAEALRYE